MSNFKVFKEAVQKQFKKMSEYDLFVTNVDKDSLWEMYLSSFPEGTNPKYRERTEHDCQCCKQFIRACGNVVAIKDGKLLSIWDNSLEEEYGVVSKAMAEFVKNSPVVDVFAYFQDTVGTDYNFDGKTHQRWEHFFLKLPKIYVKKNDSIPEYLAFNRDNKNVLERSLKEITLDSAETVHDLIVQNSLYRGTEHKHVVDFFITHKKKYDKLKTEEEKSFYCWEVSRKNANVSRIRNTVIGTLLVDISEGKELDVAVAGFESKVAPTNYKRTTAVVTKGMIEQARKKVEELGIEASLKRRYAVEEDITINNVLYADRSVKKNKNIFDEMIDDSPVNPKSLSKVEEITIDNFINNVLPNVSSVELLLSNKHQNNLMSLIAPEDKDSPRILKWDNNFTWSYNGEVTDSIKERVKQAGGKVDGVLRFSIQWNEDGKNNNDLDAHCREPDGNHIYFAARRGTKTVNSGELDVDIRYPGDKVAVENIAYSNKAKMPEGIYEFSVHNFSDRGGVGFSAQIEFDGKVFDYYHSAKMRDGATVVVAKVKYSKKTGFELVEGSMKESTNSKTIWNINTEQFHKVKMIMKSPNHWDDQKIGNEHYFFILDGCKNENETRGFYNEFLKNELTPHRKVFELLSSKMKVEPCENQLSGVGFSTTQQNEVVVKVGGKFTRMLKIKF